MAYTYNNTSETATISPQQRVVAMIDDLAAKGRHGELILQQIERQVVGFSSKNLRLAFFWTKIAEAKQGEGK